MRELNLRQRNALLWGGDRASPQNEDLKTSEKIAQQLKIGSATVSRAYDLFLAHNAIRPGKSDTREGGQNVHLKTVPPAGLLLQSHAAHRIF